MEYRIHGCKDRLSNFLIYLFYLLLLLLLGVVSMVEGSDSMALSRQTFSIKLQPYSLRSGSHPDSRSDHVPSTTPHILFSLGPELLTDTGFQQSAIGALSTNACLQFHRKSDKTMLWIRYLGEYKDEHCILLFLYNP